MKPLFIAGPCVIESTDILEAVAQKLVAIREAHNVEVIFKASFDKANRTSLHSFRGPGLQRGLQMLADIKERYALPVTTDIHETSQAAPAGEVCDVIQIPAFLCRQTDLLVAAAQTGRIVNIKKAQFLAAADMQYPVEKVREARNLLKTSQPQNLPTTQPQNLITSQPQNLPTSQPQNLITSTPIWLTERGTTFGPQNLVVDFRNLSVMAPLCDRVIMDCTHACQRPGGAGTTGGDRQFVPAMALAAKAFGAQGYFFEVHPDPDHALSDGPNMLHLDQLEDVIKMLIKS